MDFPGGASGKEPARQYRRHKRLRLDPWVRKTPRERNGNSISNSKFCKLTSDLPATKFSPLKSFPSPSMIIPPFQVFRPKPLKSSVSFIFPSSLPLPHTSKSLVDLSMISSWQRTHSGSHHINDVYHNIPVHSHCHFSLPAAPPTVLTELIKVSDVGKPSTVFPQNCRKNDSRASMREHTSPLLWILISLRVKIQISPMVWALLPVHLQLSPTLPPAHSQLFPWSHQAHCHLHSAHLVSTPRFSVDSFLTHLRSPPRCCIY